MLNKSERCDAKQCPAQAAVRVALPREVDGVPSVLELQFCGHHYTKNSDALMRDDWAVTIDTREGVESA